MKKKGTLKTLLRFLRPYTTILVLSMLFAAASVVLVLSVPVLIGRVIDGILGQGEVQFSKIASLLPVIFGVAAGAAILQWLVNILNNRITYQVVRDVRNQAFAKLEILPLSYLDIHPHGELVSRIIADVEQLADGLLLGFSQLFTGVVTILCTLIFMLRMQPLIALVVVVLTPLSFLVAKFIATHTYTMFRAQSEAKGEQTAFVDEIISNQKVVKAFSREKAATQTFDAINEKLASVSLKAIFYSSLTNPCTRFVNSVVYAGVALTGALLCVSTAGAAIPFTVGALSALLAYANQYTKPFNEISGVVTELQNAFACASRVFELIDQPPQTPDVPNARILEHASGEVQLQDVYFSYMPEKKLIEHFSLQVEPGQRIAIVGPTGCGKTTVINLLMRFYDVNSGAILVDDTDVRQITRKSLRANYGMVLQETWLKNATVRENIAMGKPEATMEEITAAATAAHANGFIQQLPRGYDTVIGEDGLSQGQKQLLCIARIMLCLPPMLILDEATSSIDTRTELQIQHAFQTMMQGRTSFIVAHRLSTIREADVILVMRDGHLVEKGKHEELLLKGGFYAYLYNSQFEQGE